MFYTVLFFTTLLLISAVFSGTETAFTSVNEISMSHYGKKGGRRQRIVLEMLQKKSSVIAAILVGNNIVNTVLAVYAGAFFDQIFVNTGMLTDAVAPILASVVTIIFLLIFGEVIPKHIGVTFAKAWTMAVAYPLWLIVSLMKPVTAAMQVLSRAIMTLIKRPGEHDSAPSIQELLLLAKHSEKAGHIDSIERKLMSKSSKFNDLQACDVMIPRSSVKGVPVEAGWREVRESFKADMYTRVPVYNQSLDDILGVFNFKELVKLGPEDADRFDLRKLMMKPLFVPENVVIGEVFERMKSSRKHMAVVVDEFGSTSGIVTIEDIVERVFGMINDEYDIEAPLNVQSHANGEHEVSGSISLQELSSALLLEFSEEEHHQANTLNGLLTFLKGDFLREKDKIIRGNLDFIVKTMDGHVADKILIRKRETTKPAKAS
ncbi:MAG: hemolysin family protein [Candidatus Riflebacteria bacterium]|nr:hemolysin family protein [Candidatus Riflebacteria bacterium]